MGTRLGNVLKNLISRPATRLYPAEVREPFARARGHIDFEIEKCLFCGACARRCPAAAITIDRPNRELTFEPFRCIICEACVEACPRKAIVADAHYRTPETEKETRVYRAPVAVPSTEQKKAS